MLNYFQCTQRMRTARNGRRKLANNTYLYRLDDDTCAIRLHRTDVVLVHKNGNYTINSGGWHTQTTQRRIGDFSPIQVCQKDFEWFVVQKGKYIPFKDGIIVNETGEILSACNSCRLLKVTDMDICKDCEDVNVSFAI